MVYITHFHLLVVVVILSNYFVFYSLATLGSDDPDGEGTSSGQQQQQPFSAEAVPFNPLKEHPHHPPPQGTTYQRSKSLPLRDQQWAAAPEFYPSRSSSEHFQTTQQFVHSPEGMGYFHPQNKNNNAPFAVQQHVDSMMSPAAVGTNSAGANPNPMDPPSVDFNLSREKWPSNSPQGGTPHQEVATKSLSISTTPKKLRADAKPFESPKYPQQSSFPMLQSQQQEKQQALSVPQGTRQIGAKSLQVAVEHSTNPRKHPPSQSIGTSQQPQKQEQHVPPAPQDETLVPSHDAGGQIGEPKKVPEADNNLDLPAPIAGPSTPSRNDDSGSKGKKKNDQLDKLYKDAKRHFGTSMVPIQYIYREESEEYFANISKRSMRNGGVQIMEGDTKNVSGHPQRPFVIDQMKGLYFSTFVQENGDLPSTSHFGEHRISVNADYFLQPEHYRLFFADFHSAKEDTKEVHYVTLVLAERGSEQEQFCLANLKELNMSNNPLLAYVQLSTHRQGFVAKNGGNDQVYLFHAADFNITKCGKECIMSHVEMISGNDGDKNDKSSNNNDNNAPAAPAPVVTYATTLLKTSNKNSRDGNKPPSPSSAVTNKSNKKGGEGWQLWNFDFISKDKEDKVSPTTVKEQWSTHMKKHNALFPDVASGGIPVKLLSALEPNLPSEMAKQMGLNANRELGISMFHKEIIPVCSHENFRGGTYMPMSLHLTTETGNSAELAKYDRLFYDFFLMALYELPTQLLKSEVKGISVRANIQDDGKKMAADEHNNKDPADLPCKFTFEICFQRNDENLKDMFHPLRRWNHLVAENRFEIPYP